MCVCVRVRAGRTFDKLDWIIFFALAHSNAFLALSHSNSFLSHSLCASEQNFRVQGAEVVRAAINFRRAMHDMQVRSTLRLSANGLAPSA